MSAEREATVIAEIRRTHAQLRNGRVTAEVGASGIEWSMRFTVEEVDVLLAIVDERDDLKRRLLEDWEGDELEGIPIRCNEREPGVPREARARRCELDAGHDGYHNFIARPELRSEVSSGCPRRDTIHDCPLGGCADASPREGDIPDVPECTDESHAHCVTKLIDGEWFTDHHPADLGRDPVGLGREARETPPTFTPCHWCELPIQKIRGAWHHVDLAPEEDAKHHPAEPPKDLEAPPDHVERCPGASSPLSFGGSKRCDQVAGHDGPCTRDGWSWAAPRPESPACGYAVYVGGETCIRPEGHRGAHLFPGDIA